MSRSGGFFTLVDRLSGRGSEGGVTTGVGCGVGMVSSVG